MTLDEFIDMVERDQPATIEATFVAKVTPNPWVNRAGHGKEARIRMRVGGLRYERQPGATTWYRSDLKSEFDLLDAA